MVGFARADDREIAIGVLHGIGAFEHVHRMRKAEGLNNSNTIAVGIRMQSTMACKWMRLGRAAHS